MAETKQIVLPITGMTCANCVATIERVTGAPVGFAGPVGLKEPIPVWADRDVQYIVTEYGAVNLKGMTTWQTAKLLISIAHPDFRSELEDAWVSI